LDFLVLAPLGAVIMPTLGINAAQFGTLVSSYAFSACVSGVLSAVFADRFDRKRVLLFMYGGFVAGTVLCGMAASFPFFLAARIATGLFGGVIGSVSTSIVADLVAMQHRGRAMGIMQSAFSASQILGIPIGLYLAHIWRWNAPFWLIAGVGVVGLLGVLRVVRPLTAHLDAARQRPALEQILGILRNTRYLKGFSTTALVALGAFLLQPFTTVFVVHNLGIPFDRVPSIYLVSGVAGLVAGPLLGRLADRIGKFVMFSATSILAGAWIVWYTNLGLTPFWLVVAANALFAVILSGRISSTMALVSGIPAPRDRGAYMALSASVQQLAGGIASWGAGALVVISATGAIENYPLLGWIVVAGVMLTLLQMKAINAMVFGKAKGGEAAAAEPVL
jgi:predicted MFS family arabinose efflux permease